MLKSFTAYLTWTTSTRKTNPSKPPRKHTLYAFIHNGSDTTTFYDEKGNYIFSFQDTDENNLFDAMKRLGDGIFKDFCADKLNDGVEFVDPDEWNKVIDKKIIYAKISVE